MTTPKVETRSLPALVVLSLLLTICLSPLQARAQNEEDMQSYVTVMDPNNVADIFGSRISKRFIALQVTVENLSDRRDYLIHDISLDLDKVFPDDESMPPGGAVSQDKKRGVPILRDATKGTRESRYQYRLSSIEHSLMRGVAEKGQGQDKRNLFLRLLRGVGTVAAGFMGVVPLGKSYAPTLAMFNGPALTAYTDTFPDYTINQLNRLNDSAYRANTLVGKQQSKVLVVFVPQSLFLTNEQRKVFKDNLVSLAYKENGGIDFRRAGAIVKGSFIEEVNNQPPSITTARFDSDAVGNFQTDKPVVRGRIIGKRLASSDIRFAAPVPSGFSVEKDGTPTDDEFKFIIKADKPIPPDKSFNLELSNNKGTQTTAVTASYVAARPTVTAIAPLEVTQPEDETSVQVQITGSNFMPGISASDIFFDPQSGVRAVSATYESPTSITATFKIAKDAATGKRDIKLKTREGGMSLEAVGFTVKEKEGTGGGGGNR